MVYSAIYADDSGLPYTSLIRSLVSSTIPPSPTLNIDLFHTFISAAALSYCLRWMYASARFRRHSLVVNATIVERPNPVPSTGLETCHWDGHLGI